MKRTDSRTGPILILTIANGAGHSRAAAAIATAIDQLQPSLRARVVDVADYMSPIARFTHVTAYLSLVKYTPGIWNYIDKYQKRQTHTSPDWYYRAGCRRLFSLVQHLRPSALVATEVGCCEIAALIKRELSLHEVPLVAVNVNYDADCAWVKNEVDIYCVATEQTRTELLRHGALRDRVRVSGTPLDSGFSSGTPRRQAQHEVREWLDLTTQLPLILLSGGGEGLGRIEEIVHRLLKLHTPEVQLVVLTGRNARLRQRLNRLAQNGARQKLRILPWTTQVATLMHAADLLVSKLGNTFDEAMAAELPLVALRPPPGSERVQYELLETWGVGAAVRTIDELVVTVSRLLSEEHTLTGMRQQARLRSRLNAATMIAELIRNAQTVSSL
jgi:processive 1,2-diacylglycerol beta-glucosyltransferase